jgi:hypothetical protein
MLRRQATIKTPYVKMKPRYRYISIPIKHPLCPQKLQITGTTYTLHALDKYTMYTFRVEAYGKNGAGLTSPTMRLQTLSDAPTAPPQDVTAEAIR